MCRILGHEHLSTSTARENLSVTLTLREQYKEACELQLEVLVLRKRILGEDHVDTIRAAWNLLGILSNLENGEKALYLLNEHLKWLQERHPCSLRPDQRQLRDRVPEVELAIAARTKI